MMHAILNHMRRAADEVNGAMPATYQGTVSGYDPSNYAVKVLLQPEGVLTDWIPLKAIAVGNGFGIFAAPNLGDAIEVSFLQDDGNSPSAGWRSFNDSERPLAVPAGEIWIVHASGSSWKMTGDGKVSMADPSGTSLILSNDGNVRINGNLIVSGDVTAEGTSLHAHKHSGVQSGSSQTGSPV